MKKYIVLLFFAALFTTANAADFKITTWNVEWLSCTDSQFNQQDRETQIKNVALVIKALNADLVALQEVGTSSSYATIDTLVKRLGREEWAGEIKAWSYDNCAQNQGIVYKKSKVQCVSSLLVYGGGSSYDWSNGRNPALYNVNFLFDDKQIPVSFVNIHAKASSDQTSYTRRQNASIGLKNLLDGTAYNTKKVIVIGDFNDYLIGTQSDNTASPYKNFMDDAANYKGITSGLKNPWYHNNPTIDNMIISNELFGNYVSNSAKMETSIAQNTANFPSDHIPASATFRFSEADAGIKSPMETSTIAIQVYPNPSKGIFTVSCDDFSKNDKIEVFSTTGLPLSVHALQPSETTIDLTTLPAGFYILKLKNKFARIIKQ